MGLAHHLRSKTTPGRRGEAGAIIILALAFLFVILILVTSMLSLAFTGSSSIDSFRAQRAIRYNAEGALNSTIQYLKLNPGTRGISIGAANDTRRTDRIYYAMSNPGLAASNREALAPSSVLMVVWTAQGTTSGVSGTGGSADGGQNTRDVVITVTCLRTGGATRGAKPGCASEPGLQAGQTASGKVVARAEVRFEIDYAAADATQRATVPKIVSWSVTA